MCSLKEQNDFVLRKKEEVKKMGTNTLLQRMQAIKTAMDSLTVLKLDNSASYRWLRIILGIYTTESVARLSVDEKIPIMRHED